MEEIKAPKKERKFLKGLGEIALVIIKELVLGIGKKLINKVGNKRQGLSIALIIFASSFAFAQFPSTGNKQRLGFQTTGDGLVWRGALSDTASIQPVSNQNAWLIIDTVNLKIYSFDFTSNIWGLVGGGTSGLTMPFDSITFNTAKNGTVGVGEVEYNDTQGSLIQGLKGGLVTNVIGQQLHQRVNNRTGATLAKGTAVYLSGSQGNRITVAKALGVTDAYSASTFGIVAESIENNKSGYVITEGLITNINTSALVEDSAVYLSPTVAGGLTSTKPQAPQHTVYIGVCVKSNAGSGELFVKIRNGQELDELHDVRITSPVNKASLYYLSSGGVWRDTTASLLVSDTSSMLSNYALKSYADTSGRFYARQDFRNVSSTTLTWTQNDTLVVNDTTSLQVYRNGQILLPSQYTVPTKTTVVIGATAYKLGENYTVILPRGGGGGGSGSGSLTSISGGTGITVSPNPITTTGTVSADLSVLMELTDTTLLNLTTRFAAKQNNITLTTTGTSGAATLSGATLNIPQYTGGSGTVTSVATGYGLNGGTITTTGTLRLDSATVFNRIRDSIVNVKIGNDTIKILKQEYLASTTNILTWTVTVKFPIQLRAYILVFRNGQLLNNDQYSISDTNKITIVSTSFKSGANYTIATVSGIGSVSSAQANPIYPEAGIALSTGTTWTTSIVNNSANWNTAYTDRLKWDGGSTGIVAATGRTSLGGTTIGQSMFTLTNPSAITFPQFNADNSVTALSAANFRTAIGSGTVTSVTVSATSGNPLSITNATSTPVIELLSATTARNGYLTSTDWTTFNGKQNALNGNGFVKATGTTISYDNTNYLPLSGGTLTGNLDITNSSNSILGLQPGDNNMASRIQFKHFGIIRQEIVKPNSTGNLQFRSYTTGTATGGYDFYVSNGTMESLAATIGTDKSLSLTGTLSVTDAVTLSNLAGSGTRMVTASTTGVLSTQAIPSGGSGTVTSVSGTGAISVATGTTTPVISVADAAFGIAGIISSGAQQFSGDKTFEGITQFNGRALFKDYTYTATRLAGLSSTDRFATVTLGTGLSLSSGTLSATGGSGTVTEVTGTLPISVTNGTTTPAITIANASTSAAGVVTTGTQSFVGSKTFTGLVGFQRAIQRPVENVTVSSASITTSSTWVVVNNAGTVTLTFPAASSSTGTEFHIKTITNNSVISASSNVVPLTGGGAAQAILSATAGKWATLVSDGTNWVIMQAN